MPPRERRKFIVGELEQEGDAFPVGQADRFGIVLAAAAQQGFDFLSECLGLRRQVERFVAGVAQAGEQREGAGAQVAAGRGLEGSFDGLAVVGG